jgi:hypothetical protein
MNFGGDQAKFLSVVMRVTIIIFSADLAYTLMLSDCGNGALRVQSAFQFAPHR